MFGKIFIPTIYSLDNETYNIGFCTTKDNIKFACHKEVKYLTLDDLVKLRDCIGEFLKKREVVY